MKVLTRRSRNQTEQEGRENGKKQSRFLFNLRNARRPCILGYLQFGEDEEQDELGGKVRSGIFDRTLRFTLGEAVLHSPRMKKLLAVGVVVMFATPLVAEDATLKQSVVLKSDRSIVSLKPGTVVELVSRDGNEVTIKYRNLTGKIPASKLEAAKPTAAGEAKPTAVAEAKPSEETKAEKKAPEAKPANPPQTNYGRAVQKAKDNAASHDKNLVKPTDEVLKER